MNFCGCKLNVKIERMWFFGVLNIVEISGERNNVLIVFFGYREI